MQQQMQQRVGSAAADEAGAPESAQKQYQHLKGICQGVDNIVKGVQSYGSTQREEGQLCGDVLNSIQGRVMMSQPLEVWPTTLE